MSEFVVDNEHLHVLIWAATITPDYHHVPLSWTYGNPSHRNHIHPDNLTEIGQMLLDANTDAVNYARDEHGAHTYTNRPPLHTTWTPIEILNALHAFEYQCTAHPDWPTSQAHAFCDALQQRLLDRIPDYHHGPWAIDDTSTPNTHHP